MQAWLLENMSIKLEQNKHNNIELLRAQSYLYSRAKFYGTFRVAIAIVAVVLSPFVLILVPHAEFAVGLTGAVLTLISELWLETIEDTLKQMGARVQEQFDTGLFLLPWNEICTGQPVAPEIIISSSASYEGHYPFSNWYPDTTNIPYPLNVLVCQRASLVWDWRLRQHFASGIVSVTVCWTIIVVLFGAFSKQELDKYLLAMLFPTLPAISQTIKAWRGHTKNASEKQELENIIGALWHRGIKTISAVKPQDCRTLQDRIYTLRKEGPLVPDRWYGRLRSRYEEDMHLSAEQLKEDALRRYGSTDLK